MTAATDLLIELQLRLPSHTYRAVKRHADGLDDEARTSYLTSILAERERSEGKGREE
jgi:hypothetical protein